MRFSPPASFRDSGSHGDDGGDLGLLASCGHSSKDAFHLIWVWTQVSGMCALILRLLRPLRPRRCHRCHPVILLESAHLC